MNLREIDEWPTFRIERMERTLNPDGSFIVTVHYRQDIKPEDPLEDIRNLVDAACKE